MSEGANEWAIAIAGATGIGGVGAGGFFWWVVKRWIQEISTKNRDQDQATQKIAKELHDRITKVREEMKALNEKEVKALEDDHEKSILNLEQDYTRQLQNAQDGLKIVIENIKASMSDVSSSIRPAQEKLAEDVVKVRERISSFESRIRSCDGRGDRIEQAIQEQVKVLESIRGEIETMKIPVRKAWAQIDAVKTHLELDLNWDLGNPGI